MSTDLKYLALTAILTASLWIPYVVAQVKTNGPLQPEKTPARGARAPTGPMSTRWRLFARSQRW